MRITITLRKAMLLAALLLPFIASAYDFEEGGIYYTITSSGEVAVTYGENEYSGDVVIPQSVTHDATLYSVTSIGDSAFYKCSSLTSVTIPGSITYIGDNAFYLAINYTVITCLAVEPPALGVSSFSTHPYFAILYVPAGSEDSYKNSDWSKYFTINDYSSGFEVDGIYYTITSPGEVAVSSDVPFKYKGDIAIPQRVSHGSDYSVTSIENFAFIRCSELTSIIIPESVTSIGSFTFSGCTSLTSVIIPNSVTTIGEYTFSVCTSLTSVIISDSVTSIGYFDFFGCTSLTSIIIPESVTSIGGSTFSGCTSLTSVTIGNSVTSIGEFAFELCTSLTSITIPESVTSIGKRAFNGCTSLTSVTIGNSVTSIGNSAFELCPSLTSITIPESVTSIGTAVFRRCTSLTSITIGNSVTSIGDYAFYSCSSLTSITIPDAVKEIGYKAFYGCSLETVTCLAVEPPVLGSESFPTDPSSAILYVPVGSEDAYKNSDWSLYFTINGDPSGISETDVTGNQVEVCVTGNTVVVSGLEEGESVRVYDLTGTNVYTGTGREIPLSGGKVYIVSTPGKTFRIAL